MSMWGFARNASKTYLSKLNTGAAVRLVSGGWRAGGVRGAASGMSRYFMGGDMATRAVRMGTAAGIVGLGVAGRMGNARMEDRYGPMGIMGPNSSQVRKMLDDRGIRYT